ncbi:MULTISPECIES: PsiF family protein [unclassified Erwinia]|uniref:PsiF family protein n=1 Tax=unclassified Erwinia TaxID=2622719 RepID=UPI0006FE1CED|nr:MULTISPECIES: PsiF family protein [unclassified Erwinia]KQN63080.1 phosphate starvation-inducible protein [Erwinia sp. Leaf53]PLV61209.1 phosphate starvation-inducible protein [Erwinia sp. B116]
MKTSMLISAVLLSLLAAGNAVAADKTPQQEKMTVCNKQAGEKALKGDDRKAFMSNCLKKDQKMEGMTPQQMKMKTCNADATQKALKGDERKTFMSSCLKKG